MKSILSIFLIATLFVLSILGGMSSLSFVINGINPIPDVLEKISIVRKETHHFVKKLILSPHQKTIHILIVGNSFSFTIADILNALADADETSSTSIEMESLVKPAVHLLDLWKTESLYQKIQAQHWDYVLLQEYSSWTFSPESIDETHNIVGQLNWAIQQAGAKPVLIEIWSDKACSKQYTSQEYHLYGQDPDKVQKQFSDQTNTLARAYNIPVLPIGDYFAYVRKLPNAPNIYSVDCHHANVAGSYLEALLIYRYITEHMPDASALKQAPLPSEQAQFLAAIVSK